MHLRSKCLFDESWKNCFRLSPTGFPSGGDPIDAGAAMNSDGGGHYKKPNSITKPNSGFILKGDGEWLPEKLPIAGYKIGEVAE